MQNNTIINLFKKFYSSYNGLSSHQISKNRELFGENTIEKEKTITFFHKFLLQFKNIMVIVLLLSAIISATIAILKKEYNDLFESGLILFIVIINSIVGALQEKKAENTLALLEKKARTQAKVYRNKKLEKIQVDEVVCGDIVELKLGDIVPADLIILECNNFSCDESSLTGESKKVEKFNIYENTKIIQNTNKAFKGTIVASGNAKGIVYATGMKAEIGKIATLLKTTIKQKTPLEKNIDKIGKIITLGVSIIAVVVFLVQLLFSNKINIGDAFMTAIALAVAAIPESLPAVITIIMALGVQKLARHNAIVKTLSSVETLGCCSCICSDKTGTLTQNKMKVIEVFTSNKFYKNQEKINKTNYTYIQQVCLLCNNVKIDKLNNLIGDSTEKALYEYCKIDNFDIIKFNSLNQRIYEEPFDSSKKHMITINKTQTGDLISNIKGATDIILSKCNYYLDKDKILPMNETIRKKIYLANSQMTNNAERVLMLAFKHLNNINDDLSDNYIFVALVGIIDPPKPEVYKAIKTCHNAGLKPIMITGDHPDTAFAIGKSIGLCKSKNEVLVGKDIDLLSHKDLIKAIKNISIFARVTPEHKSKIILALKDLGNIVAMTGDGVNDAPSLKNANIGVCMGITGTDVTKSVADIIITDDNFSSIVVAVSTGRTIYNNIQKTIQFLISTNMVEVLGLFIISLLMHNSIFLLPSQILFINLITDSLPAFALGVEPEEKDIMKKHPRNPNQTIFSGEIGTAIIYQSFVQTLVVLILFVYSFHHYGNEIATTMTFLTICFMQILHAVNCKTNKSLFTINILKNKIFNISFISLFVLILCVGLIPSLQSAFSIVPLNFHHWIIVIICSISIIPLVEIFKFLLNKHNN